MLMKVKLLGLIIVAIVFVTLARSRAAYLLRRGGRSRSITSSSDMLRSLLKSELLSLLLVLELLELGLELGSCRRPRRLLPVTLLCFLCFFLLFFLPFLFFDVGVPFL